MDISPGLYIAKLIIDISNYGSYFNLAFCPILLLWNFTISKFKFARCLSLSWLRRLWVALPDRHENVTPRELSSYVLTVSVFSHGGFGVKFHRNFTAWMAKQTPWSVCKLSSYSFWVSRLSKGVSLAPVSGHLSPKPAQHLCQLGPYFGSWEWPHCCHSLVTEWVTRM